MYISSYGILGSISVLLVSMVVYSVLVGVCGFNSRYIPGV